MDEEEEVHRRRRPSYVPKAANIRKRKNHRRQLEANVQEHLGPSPLPRRGSEVPPSPPYNIVRTPPAANPEPNEKTRYTLGKITH